MLTIETIYEIYNETSGISTDTREITEGQLFIALRGDHFDGNDYALLALEKGARAALVDRPSLSKEPGCFHVPNTLSALQKLAHHHRNKFSLPVIGITGSNGKTTTKELILSVLSSQFNCLATKGNLNNHIGVPLTLLGINHQNEMAIIEMGANHPGEIGWLCNIAAPTMGVVTNVGRAHLEGFNSLLNIWDTKMALYRYLESRQSPVFINMAEPSLQPLENVQFSTAIRYDTQNIPNAIQSVSFVSGSRNISVHIISATGEDYTSEVALYGDHNQHNILAAICIASYLNVAIQDIVAGLESYQSNQNRSQIIVRDTNTFYLDAYNANPTSMKAALKFFTTITAQNKVLILGDMMELGAESEKAHLDILQEIGQDGQIQRIILVGKHFESAFSSIKDPQQRFLLFENAGQVKTYLQKYPLQNAHVLLKASRSIGLESIL